MKKRSMGDAHKERRVDFPAYLQSMCNTYKQIDSCYRYVVCVTRFT